MDEFLAELYGTNETIQGGGEDEMQKQAAAEFLVKLAAEEGVDLDTLSDDEIGTLMTHIEGEIGKEASYEPPADEAQEKLAEADFLGRAMAHAYVNELAEIEKEASIKEKAVEYGTKALEAGRKALGAAGKWTGASDIKAGLKARSGLKASAREGAKARGLEGKAAKEHVRTVMEAHKRAPSQEAMREGAKRLAVRVGLPAAGLTAAGAGGAALAGREKKSYNEAIEDAAYERAIEMLSEAGYDVEKQAAADVETRALQLLEEAGYPVNWE